MKNLILQRTSSFLTNGIQEKSHKEYQALTDDELKCAKQLLDVALDQKTYPYTKLVGIAQQLGCHVSTLKRNFPAPSRIIQLRERGQWISEEACAMMKHELEKALTSDKRPPASAVAHSLGCDTSTLRKYFPDLYHSVVARSREAFLEAEARISVLQKLQEIFSSGDEILSVKALAKRVGYSGDALWRAFPDMCRQFADRRRVKLRDQHLARIDNICDEIRQAMFELHEKGIYPSAYKIEKLMSYKCAIMTKEGHDTWKSILKELGY